MRGALGGWQEKIKQEMFAPSARLLRPTRGPDEVVCRSRALKGVQSDCAMRVAYIFVAQYCHRSTQLHLQHLPCLQPANVMGIDLISGRASIKLSDFFHDQARLRRLGVRDVDGVAVFGGDMGQFVGQCVG